MPGTFRGHMGDLRYWGVYWGSWNLLTFWRKPGSVQVQGPRRSIRMAED